MGIRNAFVLLGALLLLSVPLPAGTAEDPRVVVAACDPARWVVAEQGRARVVEACGVGDDALLVLTGGALSSCGLPAPGARSYPLDMVEVAGFDVVNLAHRDLVGDGTALAESIAASRVPVVSASFRLPAGQVTPWAPFAIVARGGRKTAFVGIAARSASLDLPGSGVVEGLVHVAHAEALRSALASVEGKADRVVLLADAPLPDVAAVLDGFPAVDAALVSARGAIAPEAYEGTRLCGVPAGGRVLVGVTLDGGRLIARQVLLAEPESPCAAFRKTAARYGIRETAAEAGEPRPADAGSPAVLAALDPGTEHPCRRAASNRAVTLTLRSIALLDDYGGRSAPEGYRFLAVATDWQNILTPEVVREQLVPVAYRIPALSDHMYAVADGRTLLQGADVEGLAGVLDWGALQLPLPGSTASGRLLFLVPGDQPLATLDLRFYDFAHGPILVPLVRAAQPPPGAPALSRASNEVLEMTLHGVDKTPEPSGTVLLSLDLRARSTLTTDADATAFDPAAEPGDRIEIGTVADWKDWRRHTQLLVDGEFAHAPLESPSLPAVPRFLPDVSTGGRLVFRIPATSGATELVCGMPNARLPDGKVIRPKPLLLAWQAHQVAPPDRPASLSIEDDTLLVEVTGQRIGPMQGLSNALALDVTVENRGDRPETFQTFEQLRCIDAGGAEHGPDPASSGVDHPPIELLWIPAGQRRSFRVLFALPAGAGRPRLSYRGVSMAKVYELAPEAAGATDAPAPATPAPAPPGPPVAVPPAAPAPALEGDRIAGFVPAEADLGGARLGVLDARTASECLDEKADDGKVFLLVRTRWQRTGEEEWRSGNLADRLYLHRRGLFLHAVWNDCWREDGYLPNHVQLTRDTTEVIGAVVFEIAPEDIPGSPLVVAAGEGATVTLPIAPGGTESPLPVLAQAENALLTLRVHGFAQPDAALLDAVGSGLGQERTLIALRVSATAKPKVFGAGYLNRYGQLIAGGEFPCPAFWIGPRYGVDGWPVWPPSPGFLPGVAEHGLLLYAVPDADGALALEFSFPDRKAPDGNPLASPYLRLEVRAGKTRAAPEPLARMASAEWEVELLGIDGTGEDDHPRVALDLRVRRLAEDKGDTLSRGNLLLRDQTARSLSVRGEPMRYAPTSNIHFPPGAVRRFEWTYGIPDRGTRLWLGGGKTVPSTLIAVPNPWTQEGRGLIETRAPLAVTAAEEDRVPYRAPPLGPEPEPGGLEAVGITGRQVNEAIRDGARFLMAKHAEGFDHDNAQAPLVILALLHSRELQEDAALYAMAVESLEKHGFKHSYDAALTIMGLAWIDPDRYRARIRRIAQALVDGQCEAGCWSYLGEMLREVQPEKRAAAQATPEGAPGIDVQGGGPIPGWPGSETAEEVTLDRGREWDRLGGDNSCSQYAVLGLLAAGKAGVKAPPETWERARDWYVKGHNAGRGWGYGSRASTTGSMTTAGLAGLSVANFFLGGTPPEAERALAEGVDWLGRNFRLDANPSNGGYHFYYLYGLERAGRLLGKEFFGAHEWYPEGARYLVHAQAGDGSWTGVSSGDKILDTSYALLFLTLATEKLGAREAVPTGPGRLAVKAGGLGGSVLFILDASGSMGADLGNETRFDAARRVVLDTLQGGGAGLEVALRVYGHRYRAIRPQADEDTELVIGFGPPDRPELAQALAKLRFRGKTPLTRSLHEALEDLRGAANDKRRVVLLTDGLESTRNADPVGAAAALKAAGVRLDVVGLCVDNLEVLEGMARAGGGSCHGASDADELLHAFRTAVVGSVPFRIHDAQGRTVAEGESGAEVDLPAGPYVVEIDMPDGKRTVQAWVHQDRTTTITVRPGG